MKGVFYETKKKYRKCIGGGFTCDTGVSSGDAPSVFMFPECAGRGTGL